MPNKRIALTLALVISAACSNRDSQAAADSELVRDLALANQTPVYPQFSDSAVGAAPEKRAAERPQTPVRTT